MGSMLDGHPSHAMGLEHYPSLMALEKKENHENLCQNGLMNIPECGKTTRVYGILRERSRGTNTPSRLRGVRGARMGMNGKWQVLS